MKRHNGPMAFGRNRFEAMTDQEVVHRAAVRAESRHVRPDGNGVWISEWLAVACLRGCQDWADAGFLLILKPVQALKVFKAGTFEITKVDHVVYVAIGIHLAPDDGQLDNHGKTNEETIDFWHRVFPLLRECPKKGSGTFCAKHPP